MTPQTAVWKIWINDTPRYERSIFQLRLKNDLKSSWEPNFLSSHSVWAPRESNNTRLSALAGLCTVRLSSLAWPYSSRSLIPRQVVWLFITGTSWRFFEFLALRSHLAVSTNPGLWYNDPYSVLIKPLPWGLPFIKLQILSKSWLSKSFLPLQHCHSFARWYSLPQ